MGVGVSVRGRVRVRIRVRARARVRVRVRVRIRTWRPGLPAHTEPLIISNRRTQEHPTWHPYSSL